MHDGKTSSEMPTATLANGFAYFSQTDPRWAEQPYTIAGREDQTIGKSGCVPTLQVMALTNLCDLDVTPPELAAWNIDNDLRTETMGTRRASWNLLAEQMGLKIETVGRNPESLETALRLGGLVVVSLYSANGNRLGTPSGHAIGLRTVNHLGVQLVDPNSQANSEEWWNQEDVLPFVSSSFRHVYRAEAREVAVDGLRVATTVEREAAERLAYAQDQA
jgi:hypothetical protein